MKTTTTPTGLPTQAIKTRHNALLTVGAVTYKLMLKMNTPVGRVAQLETILDRIATEMITLLRSATTTDEKIWILKAMGNAGMPEFITPIKDIITTTTEPVVVRTKAVYALRRIAPFVKSEVNITLRRILCDDVLNWYMDS